MAGDGTQEVQFGGDTYHFPADAKDTEILSFLQSSHRSAASPISPPPALTRTPAASTMHPSFLVGNPDSDSTPQSTGQVLKGMAAGVANVSAPVIAHRLLQKFAPKAANPATSLYPGEATLKEMPNQIMEQGTLGLATEGMGLESAPEEGGAASAAEGGVRSSAPSPTTDAISGAESRPVSPPASSATPLIKRPPGTRSNMRDAVGIIHGVHNPTSPWGVMDAWTSVKSILAKHNAEPPAAEPSPLPTSEDIAGQAAGQGRYGSPVDTWGKRVPEPSPAAPKLERIPDWKTNPSTGTPVSSIAPQTKGTLSADDLSTMLKRTGPPKGGKGQVGRAILRKNVKSIQSDIQPEGPPRPGTGPGAMLRRGGEEDFPIERNANGERIGYHGTDASNLEGISKTGIQPKVPQNLNFLGERDPKGAYFFQKGSGYDSDWQNEYNSILRARIPGENKLAIDAGTWMQGDPGAGPEFRSNKSVPPENLSKVFDRGEPMDSMFREDRLEDTEIKHQIERGSVHRLVKKGNK